MPFDDTKEGETHHENDGHNHEKLWERQLEDNFVIKILETGEPWDYQNISTLPELKSFISSLLDQETTKAREEERKKLQKDLGDFCHKQYLGTGLENGIWVYSYRNEVVNMIEDFFNSYD